MAYDAAEFRRFSGALKIDSKERGLISLGKNLTGAQQRLLQELETGFAREQHEFVVLKCRQLGVSTFTLALDLYWLFKHEAIQCAMVAHEDQARDAFRTTLQLYRATLPDEFQRDIRDDNKYQLVCDNGSRIRMMVAGTRTKTAGTSRLGRSAALVQCHATEIAYWGDFTAVSSLRNSFSEKNPDRFFMWESTANGYNAFRDLWTDALHSISVRPIFLTWWAHEFYQLDPESELYRAYWLSKPQLTKDERDITKAVMKEYGVEITPAQWAWYRYYASEKVTNEEQMSQDYPHLPELAFISSGSAFFRNREITWAARQVKSLPAPRTYRVEYGPQFSTLRVKSATKLPTLSVWKEPASGAYYVIGCDPAYASSEDSNLSVITVWRAWYNRLEQVAEFSDNQISTHALAWVLAYLAGWYGFTVVNMEVNGPGQAVLQEMKNLKRLVGTMAPGDGEARAILQHMRSYIYRKPDTFQETTHAWHTKTTYEIKERIMNGFRDYLEREMLYPASAGLVEELQVIERQQGGLPAAATNRTDDRVVAAALAVMAWNDQLRAQLLGKNIIYQDEAPERSDRPPTLTERLVQNSLRRVGILPPDAPAPKITASKGRNTPVQAVAGGVQLRFPSPTTRR